ncbi:MAG: pseudouridine-5-phosphate glycosidase [Phycisphaerae bacterium]|nr:pseudouridine-5-phosphate glycosidase [Phycisphaerae bacterium]
MSVRVSSEVLDALSSQQPVVALETAVLTAGLPKKPWNAAHGSAPLDLDSNEPVHLGLAKVMTQTVYSGDAVPAWICVLNGELVIGASLEELEELSSEDKNTKCSLSDIAIKMSSKQNAGTTVATTLLACNHQSLPNPIRTFATGGIGGVHHNWNNELDVSADITALATTPTCVVSSGAKSILDIPATIQLLETSGVPVLGLNTNKFPTFIEGTPINGMPITECQSIKEIASIAKAHWEGLNQQSAVLATVPLDESIALPPNTLTDIMLRGEEAFAQSCADKTMRTPFLLDYLVNETHGKSLVANLCLLVQNARVATDLACAL